MQKTILYIATSLDGFIARPDGNLDWLTSLPLPQTGDYGYADLLSRIGTIVIGRKSYEELIGFGIDWPYSGFDTFVVTSNREYKIKSPDTHILADNLKEFVTERKKQSEKEIWLVGGGQLVTSFLNDRLVDQMILSFIPRILGEGIPLFAGKPPESEWKMVKTEPFETGVVNLIYEKVG